MPFFATVTFATTAYFSASDDAAKAWESCTVWASFSGFDGDTSDPVLYDMDARLFDWAVGDGSDVLVDEWQAWEGGLIFDWSTAGERCAHSTVDLMLFNDMHLGLGIGGHSDYMSEALSEVEGVDDLDTAYVTQYIAMNHPDDDSASGYDFVGYDFTNAYFGAVDMGVCAEGEDGAALCGAFVADDEGYLAPGDHTVDVGTRLAYIHGSAWWFEDFPRLDLDLLGLGF